ncbi:hypothetical protein RGE_06280 [Rubrivivax gelatinosus IL144]|uniref:Uncharacterized protein n=1 Tax=Rubrivivax gelatinosus (strain NBRC 100245 / IL144) TaxID=983917 RepID=I0HLT6_RUBGI|nr:hypothetical protein RGE_06280 [Rubrivivax gelatinosus IL144]
MKACGGAQQPGGAHAIPRTETARWPPKVIASAAARSCARPPRRARGAQRRRQAGERVAGIVRRQGDRGARHRRAALPAGCQPKPGPGAPASG